MLEKTRIKLEAPLEVVKKILEKTRIKLELVLEVPYNFVENFSKKFTRAWKLMNILIFLGPISFFPQLGTVMFESYEQVSVYASDMSGWLSLLTLDIICLFVFLEGGKKARPSQLLMLAWVITLGAFCLGIVIRTIFPW